jgi:hypothetical protein
VTPEQETVFMIRGAIASLDQGTQENFRQVYSAIIAMEEKFGAEAAGLAVVLRGAELAAQA